MTVAIVFELLSMMAFARTQRIALRAAGVHASMSAMAATALAGNAISVSFPLVGPGAGSVFTFSRFRQVSDDPAPAGWALLMSGLVSNVVWILLIIVGAIVSGNPAAIYGGVLGGVGIVVVVIFAVVALHRPNSRKAILKVGARCLRYARRLNGKPVDGTEEDVERGIVTLSAFRMRPREWVEISCLSAVNWFASLACFVASILSVGAGVPWTKVILVFCAGATASSFNVTPGGLGVTEAVLAAGLVTSGLRSTQALGSTLVFRLISFWLVTLVGWMIYSEIRRKRAQQ